MHQCVITESVPLRSLATSWAARNYQPPKPKSRKVPERKFAIPRFKWASLDSPAAPWPCVWGVGGGGADNVWVGRAAGQARNKDVMKSAPTKYRAAMAAKGPGLRGDRERPAKEAPSACARLNVAATGSFAPCLLRLSRSGSGPLSNSTGSSKISDDSFCLLSLPDLPRPSCSSPPPRADAPITAYFGVLVSPREVSGSSVSTAARAFWRANWKFWSTSKRSGEQERRSAWISTVGKRNGDTLSGRCVF